MPSLCLLIYAVACSSFSGHKFLSFNISTATLYLTSSPNLCSNACMDSESLIASSISCIDFSFDFSCSFILSSASFILALISTSLASGNCLDICKFLICCPNFVIFSSQTLIKIFVASCFSFICSVVNLLGND